MWFTRKSTVPEINSQRKRFLKMKKTYANRHGYIGRIPQHSISVQTSDSEQNSFIHSSLLWILSNKSVKNIFLLSFCHKISNSLIELGKNIAREESPPTLFLFFLILSFVFQWKSMVRVLQKIKNPKPNQITTNQTNHTTPSPNKTKTPQTTNK